MHGSALKALIKTLREAGVTRYSCGDLTIELGPPPAAPGVPKTVSPEDIEGLDLKEEAEKDGITDWRFALERLGPANFGRERRPMPRKRSA